MGTGLHSRHTSSRRHGIIRTYSPHSINWRNVFERRITSRHLSSTVRNGPSHAAMDVSNGPCHCISESPNCMAKSLMMTQRDLAFASMGVQLNRDVAYPFKTVERFKGRPYHRFGSSIGWRKPHRIQQGCRVDRAQQLLHRPLTESRLHCGWY